MGRTKLEALIAFFFISSLCTAIDEFSLLDSHDVPSIVRSGNCTVQVPELASYVSTQIDFYSPQYGAKFELGSIIPLEVGIMVLPSLPLALQYQTSICFAVDQANEASWCSALQELSQLPHLEFPKDSSSLGVHHVYAWLELTGSGTRLDCHIPEHDASKFYVVNSALERQEPAITLLTPLDGSTTYSCDLHVAASIKIPPIANSEVYQWYLAAELRLRGVVIQNFRVILPTFTDELVLGNYTFAFVGPLPYGSVVQIRINLQRTLSVDLSTLETVSSATPADVFLKRPLLNQGACTSFGSHENVNMLQSSVSRESQDSLMNIAIVTAADEAYADRLSNLIGSIHFWESETGWTIHHDAVLEKRPPHILVYDLGLDPSTVHEAKKWAYVELLKLPTTLPGSNQASVPSFVRDPQMAWLVSWKPLVVLDALSKHSRVLWIDANAELRFPLDIPRREIENEGHFFTTAGHLFPTPKTVRQSTLQNFNISAAGDGALNSWAKDQKGGTNTFGYSFIPFASRVEFTSALMGFKRGSMAHTGVLIPMYDCCVTQTCIWPNDAVGNTNQRRDQSVLNAALAKAEIVHNFKPRCFRDKKWWAWTGQETVKVPIHHGDFNGDLVNIFSRRAGHPKPYSSRSILSISQ